MAYKPGERRAPLKKGKGVKTGSQILAMIERLTKDYYKCKKLKTAAHYDTVFVLGMLTMGNWTTTDKMDKEVMEKLNSLYDE